MEQYLIGVDYDEFVPDSYRGVYVIEGNEVISFNNGDFIADLKTALDAFDDGSQILLFSSVFDYAMDSNSDRNSFHEVVYG